MASVDASGIYINGLFRQSGRGRDWTVFLKTRQTHPFLSKPVLTTLYLGRFWYKVFHSAVDPRTSSPSIDNSTSIPNLAMSLSSTTRARTGCLERKLIEGRGVDLHDCIGFSLLRLRSKSCRVNNGSQDMKPAHASLIQRATVHYSKEDRQ